jgi:predicted Rossmann-fold nucleotide-binding protein
VREEIARRFQESTILAFYGSAFGLDPADTERISSLVDKLTSFIGHNLGVLTGGGGGVMRLATDQARAKGALTGACFLELEAQPPELGVDFFNTFRNRHGTSGKSGLRRPIFASSMSVASARSRKWESRCAI